jgi:hypothetical protein
MTLASLVLEIYVTLGVIPIVGHVQDVPVSIPVYMLFFRLNENGFFL